MYQRRLCEETLSVAVSAGRWVGVSVGRYVGRSPRRSKVGLFFLIRASDAPHYDEIISFLEGLYLFYVVCLNLFPCQSILNKPVGPCVILSVH